MLMEKNNERVGPWTTGPAKGIRISAVISQEFKIFSYICFVRQIEQIR